MLKVFLFSNPRRRQFVPPKKTIFQHLPQAGVEKLFSLEAPPQAGIQQRKKSLSMKTIEAGLSALLHHPHANHSVKYSI